MLRRGEKYNPKGVVDLERKRVSGEKLGHTFLPTYTSHPQHLKNYRENTALFSHVAPPHLFKVRAVKNLSLTHHIG